ncbi:unnamed protein product [Linum trigynum]|uniref:IST1-like protein n=1 Tax=Linum trigynum TaxID=586398 RepID=A0AAV2CYZ1_9ROSI
MTAASAAVSSSKKLMKFTLSIFWPRFNSSKCKMAAKMTVARIKLLRNKRQTVVRQMRRDVALLLQSGQDATARIRVEHVIHEQNVLAANEFIELFCELLVSRLSIISKQRDCPADLKEGIASLMFAAPRCSEIPELVALKDIFQKKYGTDFVNAATDLRPDCGVNRMLIDKLSVRPPSGEVKLKVMKEIAKEYQVDWDTAESEKELLKPPEELIDGPSTFASASSFPVKLQPSNSVDPHKRTTTRSTNEGQPGDAYFGDAATAADAAAESAKQAIAAAQAAAYLADRERNRSDTSPGMKDDYHQNFSGSSDCPGNEGFRRYSYNDAPPPATKMVDGDHLPYTRRHSYNGMMAVQEDDRNVHGGTHDHDQRCSSRDSNILFDESDCDEEIEMENPSPSGGAAAGCPPPPVRLPPPVPAVHHPKLPDYDQLAARFEALKYRKPKA